ncbi:MAG: hypothetical protein SF162_19105 [bacterium]|nr:hypothetical protein [bacterium]
MILRFTAHLTAVLCLCMFVPFTAAQETFTAAPETPSLLSAFFGLDDALPRTAAGLCRRAPGRDGMPVIFSHEIDPDTLQPEDFLVVTETGAASTPLCATLSPAIDAGELRTVLLIGDFGSAETDPPVSVGIVGDVLTSGNPTINFLGARVDVTPLSAGPGLVLAERVPESYWALDQRSGRQQGDGCPSDGTVQVVRTTWAGGVSNAQGDEAGDAERLLYRVIVRLPDGADTDVTPFALADLGDGDNNHLLCLDVAGEPLRVTFPAGYLLDPNRDTLNPAADIAIR